MCMFLSFFHLSYIPFFCVFPSFKYEIIFCEIIRPEYIITIITIIKVTKWPTAVV
jgi:hypothetical protein